MAEPVNPSLIPESLGGWIGTLTAFILGFLMWTTHRKKGQIDESALVLGEWKKLIEVHQTQIADLTTRLIKAEERIAVLEEENRLYRIENDGLKAQMAQASRSQAVMLAPSAGSKAPTAYARFGVPEDQQNLLRKMDEKDVE